MSVTKAQVEAVLKSYHDPYLEQDLITAQVIRDIQITAQGQVAVSILMEYPVEDIKAGIAQVLKIALENITGVTEAQVNIQWRVLPRKTQADIKPLANIKNIIAVASGKGGVGKSTTAVNIALALAQAGARVGLLDADIYGPSQPIMLGTAGSRPVIKDKKYIQPMLAHGIQSMSVGYLIDQNTPMVWRGPMVSRGLEQLLQETLWDNLDYLIVDMPPGTGDIQLTLAQKAPVSGTVIVTTPQDIALLDAQKGIEMFRKVNISVLGIIENMAVHICSHCGHAEHIFGEGGGEKIAAAYATDLLGSLPLTLSIREQTDGGCPTVAAEPDGPIALMYRTIARKIVARLAKLEKNPVSNKIEIKSL